MCGLPSLNKRQDDYLLRSSVYQCIENCIILNAATEIENTVNLIAY
jgi:hypothetical protein